MSPQYKFPFNGQNVVLYDCILDQCTKPLPKGNRGAAKQFLHRRLQRQPQLKKRGAAAALCFRVAGNDDQNAQKEFRSLSIEPQ